MTDSNPQAPQSGQQPAGQQIDPEFFACSNTYLDIANQQARQQGMRRVSGAILFAAARYNVHAYLGFETDIRGTKDEFLNHMTDLYRSMLEDHLMGIANERGIALDAPADQPAAANDTMPPV
ncbi:DUF3144 domain-containing protein [Solilutibacter silvestris]|uniref:DUF3144 domain-containing protein n=1 Tax=Solilutibacter silvestris TaxID=1645665 RepID=A0A2K1PYZ4_9GAMM|nr:DUF3144 domain-containing protein [Lysobacter silvestris]PNS08012.1 hypothetical protein Lysil_2188 [Lysobacter silvestris]